MGEKKITTKENNDVCYRQQLNIIHVPSTMVIVHMKWIIEYSAKNCQKCFKWKKFEFEPKIL